MGFVWAAAWYWWFRDEPRDHASVNAAERDYIEVRAECLPRMKARGAMFFVRAAWSRCVCQYVGNTYGFYFFITWLPSYLTNARGMQKAELAIFAGLPLDAERAGRCRQAA